MPDVISKSFDELTARELHDILRLRCDVFVVEQACVYPDVDGNDVEPGTTHHWIERDREPVAYLRVQRVVNEAARIGRVATAPSARGVGLAAELVTAVASTIDGDLVLDAQSHLTAWYERLGFVVHGAEFVEDGIAHIPMRRS